MFRAAVVASVFRRNAPRKKTRDEELRGSVTKENFKKQRTFISKGLR